MDILAPLARHVLFPVQCAREGSGIPASLRELEASQWWEPARLEELQLARLRRVLAHAGAKSPYWRRVFADAGFDPAAVGGTDDLRRLPTLSKRDLQQNREGMRAPGHAGRLIADKTGGSTGEPVRFDLDERRYFYRHAVALRHDRWTGWDIGRRVGYLWGHREDVAAPPGLLSRLRVKLLERRTILDTSSLSAIRMDGFRRDLLRIRPPLYVGYANAVHLYARYLRQQNEPWHRPQGVITSAEYLAPAHRTVIEEVLGPVYDRYGSRETGLVASECGQGGAMHVAAESILVEILRPDGRPAAPGEQGRVVVTDLLNLGMPLLRYEIRDMAEPVAGACPCGRGLPRLKMAGGRVTDFLLARDGRIVSGASLTIYLIANAPGVAQAQFVQKTRGEVRVRVVPGEGYGPETAAWILGELPRYFGDDMSFGVDEVAEIPLAASGKHRFSICELDAADAF